MSSQVTSGQSGQVGSGRVRNAGSPVSVCCCCCCCYCVVYLAGGAPPPLPLLLLVFLSSSKHSTTRPSSLPLHSLPPSLTDQLTAEPQPPSHLIASSRQPPSYPGLSGASPASPSHRESSTVTGPPVHPSVRRPSKNKNNNIVSLAGAWKTQRLTSKSVYRGDALALQEVASALQSSADDHLHLCIRPVPFLSLMARTGTPQGSATGILIFSLEASAPCLP